MERPLTLDEALEALRRTLDRNRHITHHQPAPPPVSMQPTGAAEPLERLGAALRQRTGLVISDAVHAKLARILARLPATAVDAWIGRLETAEAGGPDWAAVIENLTVHETYFFRDLPQMTLLRTVVLPQAIAAAKRRGDRRLRLWSAGCATGEEVYSVVILALEALAAAGHAEPSRDARWVPEPGWTLDVCGTDISRPVLVRAQEGLFLDMPGLSPFRGMPPGYFRWFDEVADDTAGPDLGPDLGMRGWRIGLEAAALCRFGVYNLAAEPPPAGPWDVVLCRNVLIYLEPSLRDQVVERLAAELRPGGFLLLGPTDQAERCDLLAPLWYGGAIVYRRRA